MRSVTLLFFGGALISCVLVNARAQTIRCGRGIYFEREVSLEALPPITLDWIRKHRPRQIYTIYGPTAKNSSTDTILGYSFAYAGNNIQVSIAPNRNQATCVTIEQYDERDSILLRTRDCSFKWGSKTDILRSKETFDSVGRSLITRDSSGNEGGPLHETGTNGYQYFDDGHSIRTVHTILQFDYPRHDTIISIEYYGKNRRIDSALNWQHEREYFYYDQDSHLHFKRRIATTRRNKQSSVDSFFYFPNGLISRTCTYDVKGKHHALCLYQEYDYDTHGNLITWISPGGKEPTCGEDLDTINISYEYDSRGRPTTVTKAGGRDEYQWGDDDRVIGWKSISNGKYYPSNNGDVLEAVHYIYKF